MTMWGKADEEQGKFEVQRVDHNETAESVEDKGGKVYTLRFDDHRLVGPPFPSPSKWPTTRDRSQCWPSSCADHWP